MTELDELAEVVADGLVLHGAACHVETGEVVLVHGKRSTRGRNHAHGRAVLQHEWSRVTSVHRHPRDHQVTFGDRRELLEAKVTVGATQPADGAGEASRAALVAVVGPAASAVATAAVVPLQV